MTRQIKYKPISEELARIVKPSLNSLKRTSVGFDQSVGEYYFINIEQLVPFRNQARNSFNEEEIKKLASSIKEYGIRQPLTVKKSVEGKYEVISGERRLRAAKIAGLAKVPCILLEKEQNPDAIALIENIHRKDLHPIEFGNIYNKLIKNNVFESQDKLAQALSISSSKVSENIKLSYLPEEIKIQVIEKNIVSRDKLRNLIKAYEKQDIKKMNNIVGLDDNIQKNFSIVRISFSEGEIKIQNSGIKKLSDESKKLVKNKLQEIINLI